jgi:hypothetical protein
MRFGVRGKRPDKQEITGKFSNRGVNSDQFSVVSKSSEK